VQNLERFKNMAYIAPERTFKHAHYINSETATSKVKVYKYFKNFYSYSAYL